MITVRHCICLGVFVLLSSIHAHAGGVFDIRDYGAAGDGQMLDTAAIQAAINACAEAGGGQVLIPPGRFLSGTIHLRSHVHLHLEAGARLIGTDDLSQYEQFKPPEGKPESRWGRWHRALILGEGIEHASISGAGVIDGAKVFDPKGEENMRGPHTVLLGHCSNIEIRDLHVVDSANYAFLMFDCDDIDYHGVTMTGGWDGIHFRGWKDEPCRRVTISDCRFFTGDDAIAGRYWDDVLITRCVINSSCNGIRVIGPATNLIVHDCLFFGPGRQEHRSSKRNNMLAAVNLQPGGWDATEGALENVTLSDLTMRDVASAFHFIIKPGNTGKNIQISRVDASGVYRSACAIESWAETAFENVMFRDVSIEFAGGGKAGGAMQVKTPGVDPRPLPAWGFYARNVNALSLESVRLRTTEPDKRPAMIFDQVNGLFIEDISLPQANDMAVTALLFRDGSDFDDDRALREFAEPEALKISVSDHDSIKTGNEFSVKIQVQNEGNAGWGRVDLMVEEALHSRWVWLDEDQRRQVPFSNLHAPDDKPVLLNSGSVQIRITTPQP